MAGHLLYNQKQPCAVEGEVAKNQKFLGKNHNTLIKEHNVGTGTKTVDIQKDKTMQTWHRV